LRTEGSHRETEGSEKKLTSDARRLFLYRLASQLGEWDVFGLRDKISPEQVDEWMAYDEIEPLRGRRTESILSLVGSHLATCLGWDIPPSRFFPHTDDEETDEPQTLEEMQAEFSKLK
jgi:hypothetical protein